MDVGTLQALGDPGEEYARYRKSAERVVLLNRAIEELRLNDYPTRPVSNLSSSPSIDKFREVPSGAPQPSFDTDHPDIEMHDDGFSGDTW
jgi:hypothetical protein